MVEIPSRNESFAIFIGEVGSRRDPVVVCGDSVDAHNPKVVRSSAGAVLGVTGYRRATRPFGKRLRRRFPR